MIVVLHDGQIGEGDTADMGAAAEQAEESAALLRELGHETQIHVFDENGRNALLALRQNTPGLTVLNIVEMIDDRDDTSWMCPAWLAENGFRYTGNTAEALKLADNKLVSKALLQKNGIPTAPWIAAEDIARHKPDGQRWILKSSCLHASLGIGPENVSADFAALAALAQERARALGGEWFIERYIEGREFNMGLMGCAGEDPALLPAAEMMFAPEIYKDGAPRVVDYKAKWDEDSPAYGATRARYDFPPEDAALIAALQDICRRCWRVFGLSGYARVDFRVDEAGNPFVLEANGNPALAIGAGFMNANARIGLAPAAVMAKILAYANEPADKARKRA